MRKRVRLILALVNGVLIVAAVLIVNSRAAENGAPNYASFVWPAETEPALRSLTAFEPLLSGGSSVPAAATPAPFTAGTDVSAPLLAPTGTADSAPFSETTESFEQVWNAHVHPAFAPIASDSSSSQPAASLSGYGSAANTPGYSARSARGGYGGGGGGGFPSSGGGGTGGGQGSPGSASNNRAGLLSQSDSSLAGTSLLPTLPSQAGRATLPNPGAGSTGVSQLQPVAVPEPSTLLLLGGGLALATYRRRRKLTP